MSLTFSQVFGEVRSVVQGAPSAPAWEALCRALERGLALDDARTMDELVPYVEAGLSRWPDELRRRPPEWPWRVEVERRGWWRRPKEHPAHPLLGLTRHLNLGLAEMRVLAEEELGGVARGRGVTLASTPVTAPEEGMDFEVRRVMQERGVVRAQAIGVWVFVSARQGWALERGLGKSLEDSVGGYLRALERGAR